MSDNQNSEPFDRKKYRREKRAMQRSRTDSGQATSKRAAVEGTGARETDAPVMPMLTTDALLERPGALKALRALWTPSLPSPKSADETTTAAAGTTASVAASLAAIPAFKVGTLEMYKRFPQAYDALMSCHDCTAIEAYLRDIVYTRIISSSSNNSDNSSGVGEALSRVRVADFGCGTGRIGAMLAKDTRTRVIYGYDLEAAMLECALRNITRAARPHFTDIRLLPRATEEHSSKSSGEGDGGAGADAISLAQRLQQQQQGKEEERGRERGGEGRGLVLELCLRPCSFSDVEGGFLESTRHPRCHLIVCAWSLSYVQRAQWGDDAWHAPVDRVLGQLLARLDNSASDAALVVIETLGNGAAEPSRNSALTRRLEETHGMERLWVRTDYRFPSRAVGERAVRFFFGEKLAARVVDGAPPPPPTPSPPSSLVPPQRAESDGGGGACLLECTGIWTYWKPKASTGSFSITSA